MTAAERIRHRPGLDSGPIAALGLGRPGRKLLAGAPEGFDGLLLSALAERRDLLHVCVDDARMARLTEALAFFAPDLAVVSVPAWDCLPYDRVSPHRDIVARRIDGLGRLAGEGEGLRLVVTTVAAFLQRVPLRRSFAQARLTMEEGASLAPARLVEFLAANGYARNSTVAEAGEYTTR